MQQASDKQMFGVVLFMLHATASDKKMFGVVLFMLHATGQ